jgi:GNAT superfamily N-acetyltransferase
LIGSGIGLRDEAAEDEAFLRRLFLALRSPEFLSLGLPADAVETLLNTQFELQRTDFRRRFKDADWQIVERRKQPIGRLYVAREMDARVLFDISLLPDCAGQGIGGRLIDHVLAGASRAGRPVTLHVRPQNPARRLYLRKGFVETGIEGGDIAMRWTPRQLKTA